MRLFHVSEDPNIDVFKPRYPSRKDLNPNIGLVWAIDEKHLPNFLTPRNCPRVCYLINDRTKTEDIEKYINNYPHVVIIEKAWYEKLSKTVLYLYEFDSSSFELQDANAGYYVSKTEVRPLKRHVVNDLIKELEDRNAELKIVDELFTFADEIRQTSFDWSLCRMGYAKK